MSRAPKVQGGRRTRKAKQSQTEESGDARLGTVRRGLADNSTRREGIRCGLGSRLHPFRSKLYTSSSDSCQLAPRRDTQTHRVRRDISWDIKCTPIMRLQPCSERPPPGPSLGLSRARGVGQRYIVGSHTCDLLLYSAQTALHPGSSSTAVAPRVSTSTPTRGELLSFANTAHTEPERCLLQAGVAASHSA